MYIFLIILYLANCNTEDIEWNQYKLKYNKNDESRFKNFNESRNFIRQYQNSDSSFSMTLNDLSDLSSSEYAQLRGFKMPNIKNNLNINLKEQFNSVNIPDKIDWRDHGFVSPVENQGQCGSCWAFSAIGALEGQYFKKTNRLITFSEQNLLDCAQSYGCNGGYMNSAFEYIRLNKGLNTDNIYSYLGYKQWYCRYNSQYSNALLWNSTNTKYLITTYSNVKSQDENALKLAVATIGPISVAIDASKRSFQLYSSGIYYEPQCSSTYLDHAVLVVGYGTDVKYGDYWIVKNSWGETWGDSGYIKMARNRNNNCGIATMASYPLIF